MRYLNTKVKLEVTQNDINRGKRCFGEACPITRAAKRKIKHVSCTSSEDVSIGALKYRLTLPKKAKLFINAFDWDGRSAVKPFTFTILVPKHLVK